MRKRSAPTPPEAESKRPKLNHADEASPLLKLQLQCAVHQHRKICSPNQVAALSSNISIPMNLKATLQFRCPYPATHGGQNRRDPIQRTPPSQLTREEATGIPSPPHLPPLPPQLESLKDYCHQEPLPHRYDSKDHRPRPPSPRRQSACRAAPLPSSPAATSLRPSTHADPRTQRLAECRAPSTCVRVPQTTAYTLCGRPQC